MINRIKNKLSQEYKARFINPRLVKDKPKIFCIGRNKTGTTSLKKAFENLNFIVGSQRKAEYLMPFYKNGDFKPILKYCKSAQVFQDFPFSYPETFKYLDRAYPNSKFILTVRDSPEQWFDSVTKFHAKMFGNGLIPTKHDLQNASYVWQGWMWESNRIIFDTPDNDPYNKEKLIQSYIKYNQTAIEYFRNRQDDFIIINLSKNGSYQTLMNFLNINSPFESFPWENKTKDINLRK